MVPLKRLFTSSLGMKYIMGASGLALVLFSCVHLLGNLTLYSGTGDLFNTYSAKLHTLGVALIAIEWALALLILLHIVTAIQVTYGAKAARPIGYDVQKSKTGPTKNTLTSRNMIVTGMVLAIFMVIHLIQFRFGPSVEQGYTATVSGVMVQDMYRVVNETFSNLKWVIFYVASMFFLGFHLRHGYWSAFQSLGLLNPRWSKPIYALGLILAILISAGFLFIPIYMYATFSGGAL